MSSGVLNSMRQLFAQSKQMMEVTDKEIEAYRKERQQIDKGMTAEDEAADSVISEIMQLQGEIDEAKAKLKLE